MSPTAHISLPERVAEIIRKRIITGALAPDTPLRQEALAAELGISKIPVREAMTRLEQDGLIVLLANRGFFVAPLSVKEAYDVFGLRMIIEPDAAAEGCRQAQAADHDHTKQVLERLIQAIRSHSPDMGAWNREFHLALIRPSGRRVSLQFVERLHYLAERFVFKHLEDWSREEQAVSEHEVLFDSWRKGDAETVTALSTTHIEVALKDLVQQLDDSRKS